MLLFPFFGGLPRNRTNRDVEHHMHRHNLFDNLSDWTVFGNACGDNAFLPALDFVENNSSFELSVEMPGVRPEDLELSFEGNKLTLRAEKKGRNRKTNEDETVIRSERYYGLYQRSVELPAGADLVKADASFKDGVLHITIPKASELRSNNKIAVKCLDK